MIDSAVISLINLKVSCFQLGRQSCHLFFARSSSNRIQKINEIQYDLLRLYSTLDDKELTSIKNTSERIMEFEIEPTATLLVIKGNDEGSRFDLGEEAVQIGRSIDNGIRLLDTEVSRGHASLERVKKQWVLTDLGSSNGSFVNGKPIQRRVLQSGDHIELGCSELVFSAQNEVDEKSNESSLVQFLMQEEPGQQSHIVSQIDQEDSPSVTILEPGSGTIAADQSLRNLALLYQISEESVSPSVSQHELLQRILDRSLAALGADRGCVLLADQESGNIRPGVFSYKTKELAKQQMPISRSIVDYVLTSKQGVRTTDAQHDKRFNQGQSILKAGVREALCVPMPGRSSLLGVIYIDITTPMQKQLLQIEGKGHFREDQLRLLLSIGRQAAMVVENNRYQDSLVKAERLAAVGQTIATLSHHIKNILQGIRGGSYLIDQGLTSESNELIRQGWGIVEKNQNRILNLVMDMLTFSKERTPTRSLAQLNDVIFDICELMQSRADELDVDLVYEPDKLISESIFDPEGIHRAVLNVVTNGIDAASDCPEGKGKLIVKTTYDASMGELKVRITDNGCGIEDDQIESIFNLFESTKGSHGTGIGLAVSQKILREHDGDITVKSQVDKGTTFELSWPFVPASSGPVLESPTMG